MRHFLLLVVLALSNGGLHAQVVLNEVSASNYQGQPVVISPLDTDHPDWIELQNVGTSPVDVGGWYLSDDPLEPQKWAFPGNTIIAPGAFLLVYASGWNQMISGIEHTSFTLNQTNAEYVVLTDQGGVVQDQYGLAQRTMGEDSRGRVPNGVGNWALLDTPTPGAPNGPAIPEYELGPVLSPAAGRYGGPTTVTITCPNPTAQVRYTLDGSWPSATSALYTGPIQVSTTTVVRAACFSALASVPPSFSETNTYLINDGHSVGILSIAGDQVDNLLNGNGNLEPVGSIEYFGSDGVLRAEAVGDFNEHGNDSWAYPQRGFDYITRDQLGYNDALHYPFFPNKNRDEYQRLIIKPAANDNYPFEPGGAHIRDAYVHTLSQLGDLKLDERTYQPCVLYVNGQYWGVYELREKVDDADFTDEYYDQDKQDLLFLKTWGWTWEDFGYGVAQADWDQLVAYVIGNDMGDPTAFAYVDERYNWQSLVDYVVLNSYTVCMDWLNWNTAWWRGTNPNGDGRRWRYALWDMDATFGHYFNYTGIPDQSPAADPCNADNLPDPGGEGHIPVLNKLMAENDSVRQYYVSRYIDLGNDIFNCDFMIGLLDSLVGVIEPEMGRQCGRWGGSVAGWQANVQVLRDFINARCVQINEGLVDCYDVSGPYDVTFKVEPPGAGNIRVNSLQLSSYPFTGQWFGGINTNLSATSNSGWVFSHWESVSDTIVPNIMDSIASIDFDISDTVIAHFSPIYRVPIVLDVDPPATAYIQVDNVLYTSFPDTAFLEPGTTAAYTVIPSRWHDFVTWEIGENEYVPLDLTNTRVWITAWDPDLVVAHLEPQEYGHFDPNAFTPNGDGLNDVWLPTGNVIDDAEGSYNVSVFDRWGKLVFLSTGPNIGWDGTAAGSPCPAGVYSWTAKRRNGLNLRDAAELAGHVTLIR
jgi:gliding motility-associated-like protein